ncbi:MAG: hypothetical protein KBC69_01475 [Candidatus Magasanikbacteria bacterium]|nr:hypothetical protein [Candidatus Magasanikbacteria bacterium]
MQNNQSQDGSSLPQNEEVLTDDLEKAVHDLMNEFDLDESQAKKLEKLEDEGYDEEDALSQVMDA